MWFESTKPWWRREIIASLLLSLGLTGAPAHGKSPVVVRLSAHATEAQIQRALDNLPPKGVVLLAAAKYEISEPIRLRHDYITLCGRGEGTILHLADGANCPVVILGPPMSRIKFPVYDLALENLIIDGNRRAQKVERWRIAGDGDEFNNDGVELWKANDAVVSNVTCCHCRSGGLVTAEVRRLRLLGYESFDNQFDGLACYQTTDSTFDGIHLHDNIAAGISLDLSFNHNDFKNVLLENNDLGIFMRSSKDNTFERVTILRSRHHGVFMAQTANPTMRGWEYVPGTACTGNVFKELFIYDSGGEAFKVNDASCTNNLIAGARLLRNVLGGVNQPPTNPVVLREVATR